MREVILGLTRPERTISLFGCVVPACWGDPREEQRALRDGAAVLPSPWEVLLHVRGEDATEFLHALLTQDIRGLKPGRCRPAALADRKGHFLADLWVLNLDGSFLLRLRRDRAGRIMELLERHRITERVDWELLDGLTGFLLLGPEARQAADRVGIEYAPGEREGGSLSEGGFWMTVSETRPVEYLIVAPLSPAPSILDRLEGSGLPRAGWEAFQSVRVERGIPWFGLDAGEERLVVEAVPPDRISVDKGCYLGQEPIARLRHRGELNWRIGRFQVEGGAPNSPGDLLDEEGTRVGWLTSIAATPEEAPVTSARALGFLHRRLRESPRELRAPGGATATWLGEI